MKNEEFRALFRLFFFILRSIYWEEKKHLWNYNNKLTGHSTLVIPFGVCLEQQADVEMG